MRRIGSILLIIFTFLLLDCQVMAEEDKTCSNKSKVLLNKAAFNVEVNYTIKKDNDKYYFEISLYNITDDIYAVISSDINSEERVVNHDMTTNNTYSFKTEDINTIINYTISIRTIRYGCSGEIRNMSLIKPRYNDLSELATCKTKEMADYSYCQKWVEKYYTNTREEIIEKINRQYEKKLPTTTTKCLTCENSEKVTETLKFENTRRKTIIIILSIGIFLDSILIAISIIRMRRYEI